MEFLYLPLKHWVVATVRVGHWTRWIQVWSTWQLWAWLWPAPCTSVFVGEQQEVGRNAAKSERCKKLFLPSVRCIQNHSQNISHPQDGGRWSHSASLASSTQHPIFITQRSNTLLLCTRSSRMCHAFSTHSHASTPSGKVQLWPVSRSGKHPNVPNASWTQRKDLPIAPHGRPLWYIWVKYIQIQSNWSTASTIKISMCTHAHAHTHFKVSWKSQMWSNFFCDFVGSRGVSSNEHDFFWACSYTHP